MILYKYIPFTSAEKIIETSTLGFSCLEDLNDPFEAKALRFLEDDVSERIIINAVRNRLSRNFGILSLTRQPLNPLMWAHYGASHTGVVIGIDVKKAKLTCEETSVIPAQHGEIIYTQTKPYSSLNQPTTDKLMSIGEEVQSFNEHDFELFKQAFLYKSIVWSYEEEVRVVKNIRSTPYLSRQKNGSFNNDAGNWNQIIIEGRPLYCLKIPRDSFSEIYLGTSIYRNISHNNHEKEKYKETVNKWKDEGISVYNCRPKLDKWELEPYTHDIL